VVGRRILFFLVGKITKKAFLLFRHSKYSAMLSKNTLVQTAFSAILPTGLYKKLKDCNNKFSTNDFIYYLSFFFRFQLPINKLSDLVKLDIAMAGFTEALTFSLV